MGLFSTKNVSDLQVEAESSHSLKRALSATNLVFLGIGAIIGAGIFVLTGQVAATNAGPAIVLSFVLAGAGCLFAGLCYAEFASMIPIAGSAYTYGYATMGEFIAWIIGWDLILEYLFAASTVAVGWAGYFSAFMTESASSFRRHSWARRSTCREPIRWCARRSASTRRPAAWPTTP